MGTRGSDPAGRPGVNTGAVLTAGCLAGVLGACAVGGAVAWWVLRQVGLLPQESGLGQMGLWALIVVLAVCGHAAVSWWAWRTRPGITATVLTQVPHAVVYTGAVAWWSGTWTAGYLLWVYATLNAIGWLTVWFLRNPTVARRAVVYLTGLGVVVAVNIAGLLSLSWDRTNGFGLRGQPTPWAAFTALAATSCLTKHPFYTDGSNTIPADCPSGPTADFYAGDYDETGFGQTLCGTDQPRNAFHKWWQWNREYQLWFTLDWTQGETVVDGQPIRSPYPESIGGSSATITYTATIEHVSTVGADRPHQMRTDDIDETWTVHLESVSLGGWKVCRIDVTQPIDATFTPQ